jgi:hypothetical protein
MCSDRVSRLLTIVHPRATTLPTCTWQTLACGLPCLQPTYLQLGYLDALLYKHRPPLLKHNVPNYPAAFSKPIPSIVRLDLFARAVGSREQSIVQSQTPATRATPRRRSEKQHSHEQLRFPDLLRFNIRNKFQHVGKARDTGVAQKPQSQSTPTRAAHVRLRTFAEAL